MLRPIAAIISDVHYNIHTLELADEAMRMAIDRANTLNVPLIVAGDLHDTKANLRGECINAMLNIFSTCLVDVYILVGNHDKINEKAHAHSLNFLASKNRYIVETPWFFNDLGSINRNSIHLIPYQHSIDQLREYLKKVDKDSCVIMHQGLEGSTTWDGHDKSALHFSDVRDFRVISGHYHYRQNIKCGRPRKGNVGLFSYIGNPFTLNYGEATDPQKGFQILMDDGSLEFIPTNLRRHIVHECEASLLSAIAAPKLKKDDLLWIKISDTRENLQTISKQKIADHLAVINDFEVSFKLDKIPTDKVQISTHKNLIHGLLLDSIIDNLAETSNARKQVLKTMWKELINANT